MKRTSVCFLIVICTTSILFLPMSSSASTIATESVTVTSQGAIENGVLEPQNLQNQFSIHGADISVNIFDPKAHNYHDNIGTILSSMNVNTVRLFEGCEGDVWGINMVTNAANDSWADNLLGLLNTIGSLGLKCYFYSLGDKWGGELGIQDPSGMLGTNPPMNITLAESYIDKLAGDNKLNYNFLNDPRIVVWSVGNEATIGTVSQTGNVTTNANYQWIIQMCGYIRSKGGKVVVPSPVVNAIAYDNKSWDTEFRWTVPLPRRSCKLHRKP